MEDFIVSAGIDIGTSTTHFTISHLQIANVSTANRVPKLAVTDRKIIFQSPIFSTPLNDDDSIDAEAVAKLLMQEYRSASVDTKQIQTGAVIITGESAKRRNAREVSAAIAEMAGDFVVASAGSRLEGLLAGRGSGGAAASRAENKTICNIDIGGGTCNFSVFSDGEMIDSACLEIGGRFIQFDKEHRLIKFTDSGETFLDGVAKRKFFQIGEIPSEEILETVAVLFSEIISRVASLPKPPPIVQRLLQTDPLRHDYAIDEFWISGGIAECMRNQNTDPFAYGDMGVYLASALTVAFAERGFKTRIADLGIRATVIGAGMHSLQLSGCTIMVSDDVLPLRNVRIIHPFSASDTLGAEAQIESKYAACVSEFDDSENLAIALPNLSALPYSEIQAWAKALSSCHLRCRGERPLIVLSREDIGLALGQTIRMHSPDMPLVILDDVDTSMGDFIDIGRAMNNRSSIPLTVKTLFFDS